VCGQRNKRIEGSQIELNKVYQIDCMELMRDLPDESIDLIVSSPPYNLGKEYESRKALDVYLQKQKEVLAECTRILRSSGSIFWQVGAYSDSGILIPLDIKYFPILESLGLLPRNRIIWIRQHGLHAKRKFSARHETILWFTKSDEYTFNLDQIRVPQKYGNKKHWRGPNKGKLSGNPKGKNPGDIWLFRNVKHNHEERTIHPCQFPEDMIARIILATTNEGDIVFDPYMGAGTVAVVARDLQRNFLGAEIDPRYHEVITRRLECRPNEDGSFASLKCLRDYVDATGEPIENFSYDTQRKGTTPTRRGQSRIYSEQYHLQALLCRLAYEEDWFAAKLRGEDPPDKEDYAVPHKESFRMTYSANSMPLFEDKPEES